MLGRCGIEEFLSLMGKRMVLYLRLLCVFIRGVKG